jgi:hypothetical protein
MRKEFILRLFIVVVIVGGILAFNFIVDPFQQYREPKLYKIGKWREEERYLNAGLIRNQKYDTILIGSSMTRNFSEEYIKNLFNWKTLKLTMSSGNQEDIKFVLDNIEKNKIKNLIIGIDLWAFESRKKEIEMPGYLYKEKLNLGDNWKYLSNIGTLKYSLKLVLYNIKYGEQIKDKFKLGYQYTYSKKRVLRNYGIKNIKLERNIKLDEVSKSLIKNYQENLKYILELYKEKNIILFFPPYSILAYEDMIANRKIEEYLSLKKYLVEDIEKYSNVKLYDFQDIKEITHNLDNYGDKSHYSPEISNKLLEFIKKDKYILNSENVDERIKKLETQLMNMDVEI